MDIDTIAPVCKAKNFISGNRIKPKQKSIQVKISDNLSGISSYNAYLNGKWLLAEYDGKSGTLIMAVKDFPKGRSRWNYGTDSIPGGGGFILRTLMRGPWDLAPLG